MPSVFGFLPTLPSIRAIVSAEAFTSSLIENIYREFPENLIMTTMFKTRYHPEMDFIYLGILLACLYTRIDSPSQNRWSSIPMYSMIQRRTNVILFTIMLILTKNIENAI